MKNLFTLLALVGMFTFGANNVAFADHHLEGDSATTEQVEPVATAEEVA